MVDRGNRMPAYPRVKNEAAAGVDGIGISEFKAHLEQHWPGERVMASITAVSGGHAQAHKQCVQGRGGAAVAEEVSGLQP